MKTLLTFIFILAIALLLSALSNPLWYHLLGESAQPHTLITTTAKFFALPLVFWAAIKLGVGRWQAIGFPDSARKFWAEFITGWVAGVLLMSILVLVLLLLGVRVVRTIDDTFWFDLGRMVLIGLVGGLLVAFIEETFVRGAMFSAMRRHSSVWFSVVFTSLYFAALHFIDPQPMPDGSAITGMSGLEILAGSFQIWTNPGAMLDSFAALTAAGMLLALIREYRGNLAFVIGIHAGWVIIIKVTKGMTWVNLQSDWIWGVGDYDQVTGLFSLGWILLILTGYVAWQKYTASRVR